MSCPPGRAHKEAASLIVLALGLAAYDICWSQSEPSTEAQAEIKANFIYTLAKFVKWPERAFASHDSPMIFCALGEDSLGPALEREVGGKMINGRALSYRTLTRIEEIEPCHVLVLGHSRPDDLRGILGRLSGASVMTVCDQEGFARLGGMVGVRLNQGMVQAEINIALARRGGLQISSRFLNLSGIVKVSARSEGD